MLQLSFLDTPWGAFAYGARASRLAFTFLPEARSRVERRLQWRYPDATFCDALLPSFRDQVLRYFAGEPVDFAVDIDLSGLADFHQRVLRACRQVPFGQTITYGQLAAKVGHPGAARAVGQAMAANPIPLVVPCHRVVAAGGRLGGFSSPSGARQKLRLLRLENALYEPSASGGPKKRKISDREELFAAEAL